jgi:hypothetical protein
MARIVRSLVNFQHLEPSRIYSATVRRQDTEALPNFQLDFRSELQIHRPVARLYLVIIKHN